MNDAWIAIGLCLLFIVGAAIPLLRDRRGDKTPLPPPAETLRDWRRDARDDH